MWTLRFFISCITICSVFLLKSQAVFDNLTKKDGLSSNAIYSMLQDKEGYMWFGTMSGLDRYDGERITNYSPNPSDSNSIRFSGIRSLFEDSKGRFWVGARTAEVALFDKRKSIFKDVPINKKGDRFVWAFYEDSRNRIFAAMMSSFHMYDESCARFVEFAPKKFQSADDSLIWLKSGFRSFTSFEKSPAIFYIAGTRNSIWEYHVENDSVVRFSNYPSFGENLNVGQLEAHSNGKIYYFTAPNWVVEFNPKTAEWNRIAILGEVFNNSSVHVLEKSPTELWVATRARGLAVFDFEKNTWLFHEHNPTNRFSINPGSIYGLLEDNVGDIWIGGEETGVSKLNRSFDFFKHFYIPKPKLYHVQDPFAYDIHNLENGNFLLATRFADGIYEMDKDGNILGTSRSRGHIGKTESINFNRFVEDKQGNLWVSSTKGIFSVNKTTCAIRKVPEIEGPIYYVYPHKSNGVWIFRTTPGELYHLNADNRVERITAMDNLPCFESQAFGYHAHDSNGDLWTRSLHGFVKYDEENDTAYCWSIQDLGFLKANDLYISDLTFDKKDRLWISTAYKGVFVLSFNENNKVEIIKNLQINDGLPTDYINNIETDLNGQIWATSYEGLCRIDPNTFEILNFGRNEGMIKANTVHKASKNLNMLPNGYGLIAGYNYFTLFNTNKVPLNNKAPKIKINGFSTSDGKNVIEKMISDSRTIELNHQENYITIQFAALNYIQPQKNKYLYTLEGYDKDWTSTHEGKAVYTKLPPGDYIFKLKGSNNDGLWNRNPTNLHFTILPAFYQTMWFKMIIGFLVFSVFSALVLWRFRLLREREQMQLAYEKQVMETEMKALRAQMNPHFMFNSLNSIKNYIIKNEPRVAARYLTKFSQLMRLILNNSEHQTVPLSDEIRALELYVELESLRFKDKFSYDFDVQIKGDSTDIKIPPMIVQPFIENAIWHGLMHKEAPGHLNIAFEQENGTLEIRIEDDGVGRQRAAELRSKSANKRKSMGTKITSDRILYASEFSKKKASYTINDKVDENGKSSGTKVNISFEL